MKYAVTGSSYKHSVGYKYDISNNLLSLVEDINDTALTTSYTYDQDNRVTSVTTTIDTGADPTTVTETYTYDAYGRVEKKETKDGDGNIILTETYAYVVPSTGKYSTQVASVEGRNAAGTVIYSYAYTYDNNGNITRITNGSNNVVYATYTYDSANQLIRADDLLAFKTWKWEYDCAGNILSRSEYSYTTGSVAPLANPVAYEYGKNGWGDVLVRYNGQDINYGTGNTDGNPVSDGTWTYTWEHGRQLASMTGNGTTWNFTYDADGMRTARSNGTTAYTYTYNGGQLSQMTVGSDTLTFTYDASGNPQTVTYGGTTYYYVTNLQGDVIAILNSAGTKVVSYTYDAWGNNISGANSTTSTLGTLNPLRYRGYVYDHETGLYYLQSRYYNPKVGRFINADALVSTGQGLLGNNMFAYCLNNPVNHHDQNGMFPLEVAMELFERWLQGDESDELYDSNSIVAQRIKESETMMAIVEDAIIKYENGEEYRTGTVIFDSSEPDLWLGVRRASYEITIHKKTWAFRSLQGTIIITEYTVSVKIIDKYNFNIGNEKGDGLGSILNNAGYYMHYYGIGKNYWWEAQFEYVKYRFTH